MVAKEGSVEFLLAELTDAAYASALRHQSQWTSSNSEFAAQESFLDLELEIWKSLRLVLERRLSFGSSESAAEAGESLPESTAATGPSAPARQLVAEVSRDLVDTSIALAGWQA
jgi:hypothetical protein